MSLDYAKLKKNFYENGFAKIPKFFTKKELDHIKFKINKILENKNKKLKVGEIHYSKTQVNTIHVLDRISNFFLKFKNKKKFLDLSEKIIGEKSKAMWVQLFAKPANEGLAAPPHQDNYYWCIKDSKTMTIWIALDKVSPKNGGLYYYNKSNLLDRVPHEASYAKGTSQTVKKNILKKLKPKSRIQISASPGDIFIHHGYTIHGSSKNLSNQPRKAISIWYKAKKAKIDQVNLKKYKLSLKKQYQALYKKN